MPPPGKQVVAMMHVYCRVAVTWMHQSSRVDMAMMPVSFNQATARRLQYNNMESMEEQKFNSSVLLTRRP